jgi:hypothetical protein
MMTRSKSIPIPGVTLRPEPRSDDDSDSDGDLKDFVEYTKSIGKPPDHVAIDKAWNAWKPGTIE